MLTLKWIPVLCFTLSLYSCSYNKGEVPAPDTSTHLIDFQKDIKPIIVQNCVMCHSDTATNPYKNPNVFFLQTSGSSADFSVFHKYATTVSSSNSAYTIVPARLRGIEQPAMPFQRASLPDSTIKKIEKWIRQGAILD